MTDLSKEILDKYQIRKSAAQKQAFAAFLQSKIPEMTVQSEGFPKNNNLIIGSPEKAQVILGAHYDTCARMPLPNFITPLNPLLSVVYSIVLMIPIFLVVFLLNFILSAFTDDFFIHYFVSVLCMFGLLALMIVGPANKCTVNDNTSGVITLCEIYAHLPSNLKETVAFVFFDNEEKGLFGSSAFRKKYKKQLNDKILINFDCVSDGDHVLLAANKNVRAKYGEIIESIFTATEEKKILFKHIEKVYYPSDQAGFPNAVAIAALNYKKGIGYYMDKIHTKKDTVMDERNITYLRDRVIQLLERI